MYALSEPPMRERIILIDSNSLIYRGYFAIPPLTTTKGELSNATFGFASILLKAIEEITPQYIAAAFDLPQKTFRHERDATYKAMEEVSGPIVAIALVLCAVFVPIAFVSG